MKFELTFTYPGGRYVFEVGIGQMQRELETLASSLATMREDEVITIKRIGLAGLVRPGLMPGRCHAC